MNAATMRKILLALIIPSIFAGCGKSSPSDQAKENTSPKANKTQLDKWSWLPNNTKHDAELTQIPSDAKFRVYFPKDAPLDIKTGWGKMTSNGEFMPSDKTDVTVKGGSFNSQIGPIEKNAKWGDWSFIYADASMKEPVAWGVCLTNGEIIIPKSYFQSPTNYYVQNSFEIESFGESNVLIHIDPAKGHKLCFMKLSNGLPTTAGFIGTKAEVDGKIFERKADGWYLGATKMSE